MILYALVSRRTEGIVEVFLEREHAEAALADILHDEPELAHVVRIEVLEVGDPDRLTTGVGTANDHDLPPYP